MLPPLYSLHSPTETRSYLHENERFVHETPPKMIVFASRPPRHHGGYPKPRKAFGSIGDTLGA